MTDKERTKFVKHLKKTMLEGATAGERTAALKLYGELFGDNPASPVVDGKIDLPELGEMNRPVAEYDYTVRLAMAEHPDDGLGCLLQVLRVPRWWAGLWGKVADGWRDKRTDTVLTFDDARQLIDDRILELKLNSDKVWAYPKSYSSMAEDTAFWNVPFEERLNRFRSEQSI